MTQPGGAAAHYGLLQALGTIEAAFPHAPTTAHTIHSASNASATATPRMCRGASAFSALIFREKDVAAREERRRSG